MPFVYPISSGVGGNASESDVGVNADSGVTVSITCTIALEVDSALIVIALKIGRMKATLDKTNIPDTRANSK